MQWVPRCGPTKVRVHETPTAEARVPALLRLNPLAASERGRSAFNPPFAVSFRCRITQHSFTWVAFLVPEGLLKSLGRYALQTPGARRQSMLRIFRVVADWSTSAPPLESASVRLEAASWGWNTALLV